VIGLGSSKAQFVYSADTVKRHFQARAARFYSLGFGYGEEVKFALALIQRERLTPKVLIIDASPFFRELWSIPALEMSADRPRFRRQARAWIDTALKKVVAGAQPMACAIVSRLCTEKYWAIYRSTQDGTWVRQTLYEPNMQSRPLDPANKTLIFGKEAAAENQKLAAELIATARIPPRCVILTAVPAAFMDARAYATEMARLLGGRVSLPEVDNLQTIDNVHLTAESIERWSEALLRDIDPIITECTGGGAKWPQAG
jgi:hypothetical protein